MFDTHVNLHGDVFADDLDDVLDRARTSGVRRFLAICDRFDNFEAVYAIAAGETGLDFHYGYSPEDAQVESLRKHIEAARQTSLPLILHTREADDMMGDVLEDEFRNGAFQPLLHCYTGGARLAHRGLALGAYVSVSGILSFKSASAVRDVIADVPMDRIILETDCPFLAPMPMRGRRNEPAYLVHVAEALASLKGLAVDEVKRVTEANARRLFAKVDA